MRTIGRDWKGPNLLIRPEGGGGQGMREGSPGCWAPHFLTRGDPTWEDFTGIVHMMLVASSPDGKCLLAPSGNCSPQTKSSSVPPAHQNKLEELASKDLKREVSHTLPL